MEVAYSNHQEELIIEKLRLKTGWLNINQTKMVIRIDHVQNKLTRDSQSFINATKAQLFSIEHYTKNINIASYYLIMN